PRRRRRGRRTRTPTTSSPTTSGGPCSWTTTLGIGAVTIAGVLTPAVLFGMPGWFGTILAGLAAVALAFGDAVGGRPSAVEELRRREEQHRQDLARPAVLEERARIARALHDVGAHHMSASAMQAEA